MELDPWNLDIPFEFNKNGITIVKGPYKQLNHNKNTPLNLGRDILELEFINKSNNIYSISTKKRGKSGYKLLEILIKIYKKNNNIFYEGHIENISKSDFYSGSDLMILALQILFRLNIKKCTLIDVSYYNCTRNNFFKTTEVPMKIIKLLKSNSTFYSPFNFQPFDKTTHKNRMNDMRNLVSKLKQIKWNDIRDIIKRGKEYIDLMNINNSVIMNYNRFEIRNINKWKKYWTTIFNSWNIFENKFNKAMTPFSAFKFFNENENCNDFIDWLELYSFTFFNFNKVFVYKFFNYTYEIPELRTFIQLREILNNVVWTNNDIREQSEIFIPFISI